MLECDHCFILGQIQATEGLGRGEPVSWVLGQSLSYVWTELDFPLVRKD